VQRNQSQRRRIPRIAGEVDHAEMARPAERLAGVIVVQELSP
jgi:hypothetical protein